MGRVDRRQFIKQAALCGAALALSGTASARSNVHWRQRRDLFPEGAHAPHQPQHEPDGGPLRYHVAHTAKLWKPGERPHLEQQVLEGSVGLSI
jgi:hypothetical protein